MDTVAWCYSELSSAAMPLTPVGLVLNSRGAAPSMSLASSSPTHGCILESHWKAAALPRSPRDPHGHTTSLSPKHEPLTECVSLVLKFTAASGLPAGSLIFSSFLPNG